MAPHVAFVDTYGPSSARFAPAFQDAGYTPIRVCSTTDVPRLYRRHVDPFVYPVEVLHRGDLAATVQQLASLHTVAVIPGCELGVELADSLSEALHPLTGTPTNGSALSAARRDKYVMIERIKAQGLRGARQLLVNDEEQLYKWHAEAGGMVVVKPLRSAGGDGVSWCRTPHDSVAAFRRLSTRKTDGGELRDGVVAQEYLVGGEYIVNTVSRDGAHHVCDIWKTHRISANGVLDLEVACQVMPRAGDIQDMLVAYAGAVLDALGIQHGAAHAEIKVTPAGPCLIEIGARVAGQDMPDLALRAIGESQVEWMVDAYIRPKRFAQRCGQPYHVMRHVASAFMVAPRSGRLLAYHGLPAIEQLDSYVDMQILVRPGEFLTTTIDDSSYPIKIILAHEIEEILLRDLWTLRQIDGSAKSASGSSGSRAARSTRSS
ncbi:MAG: ATP-grasp domain-containing protein, partial [Mycobacteriaceae bacterium]|nr:ATP-grasp domain-containing protein [Mycobacteriaceae bacterium]